MTYTELCKRLTAAGIDAPEWEASLLLAHFCHAREAMLRAEPGRDYASVALLEAVERRCGRYPLQYVIGKWEFYRQTYTVTPDCLCPRPDTEILVEEAIRELPVGAYFADLGTGCGCIAISVLCERPDTKAVAIDKFERTLALATQNARDNGVSERFHPLCADLLDPAFVLPDGVSAILSNPPYIADDERDALSPEVAFEPQAALFAEEQGLAFYRAILQTLAPSLPADGRILFEIGARQAEAVLALGRTYGWGEATVKRDLSGHDRVLILRRTNA